MRADFMTRNVTKVTAVKQLAPKEILGAGRLLCGAPGYRRLTARVWSHSETMS